eukprot:10237564-Heterocapsa_arctica.AAC.1
MEVHIASTPSGTVVSPANNQHVALHAGYGPWNGRVVAVATGDGHTEPLWWPPSNGCDTLQPSIGISGKTAPSIPW